MTVSTKPYYPWGKRTDCNKPPYSTTQCSPNLVQGYKYLQPIYGGRSLGCARACGSGSVRSSHWWKAALDYQPDGGNNALVAAVAPHLIKWSAEFGINAIHDYVRQLIWKPDKGWVSSSIGSANGQWGHIETHPDAWHDSSPWADRIASEPPPPPVGYNPPSNWGLYPLDKNKPALGPGFGYTGGTQQYQGHCKYANDVMRLKAGQEETLKPGTDIVWTIYSMAACMNVQQFFNLPVNGWMTVETWGAIDYLVG